MKILVNGIELNYDVYGEGKSVILLNPNSVHTKLFMKPIVNLFKQDFKVYCVDRRCCGKSTKDCELTYEESAKDIYEMIQKRTDFQRSSIRFCFLFLITFFRVRDNPRQRYLRLPSP